MRLILEPKRMGDSTSDKPLVKSYTYTNTRVERLGERKTGVMSTWLVESGGLRDSVSAGDLKIALQGQAQLPV